MNWVTILWSMTAASCLTLGVVYLLAWAQQRSVWGNLLFALISLMVAVYAGAELKMMLAQTPAEFAEMLRWFQVPIWVIVVGIVALIRIHLRAGRTWLAVCVISLRTLALAISFLAAPNLHYRNISALGRVIFLGQPIAVPVGTLSHWMLVGQSSLLMLVVYVADAAVTVWRRGDRRQAMVTCGSVGLFILITTSFSILELWRIVDWPLAVSPWFMCLVLALAADMGQEAVRAEKIAHALRESEEQVRLAVEAAHLGVWGMTPPSERIRGTAEWMSLFGFATEEEISLGRVLEQIHPDDREKVRHALRGLQEEGLDYNLEYRITRTDGAQRWIASWGRWHADARRKSPRVFGVAADITERRLSELQIAEQRNELAHLSRVATVSELSGSLAHELSQPLAIILTNAQAAQRMLARDPGDLDEVRAILSDIAGQVQRGSAAIRRLRSLLKPGEVNALPLNVNELVDEVLQFTRNERISMGVTTRKELAADLPPVLGDRIQLQQVLINIILNGLDAMAAKPPVDRQMMVATSHCAGMVRISISDNGCGLPPDADQIFQPFFSTKPSGLGLGLSISRSIVQAHQGQLWAEARTAPGGPSEAGTTGGATLHLELAAAGEGS